MDTKLPESGGKTLTSIPGCEPKTGKVGDSTIVSPAAGMVQKITGK